MHEITITKRPPESVLEEQGVRSWPIWSKEIAVFPWHYDEPETCYLLEGRVIVTPNQGTPVEIEAGDLVTFPAGLSCQWEVRSPVRKHYRFG
jgi:uncharacterized cupin superfamily protein